MNGESSTYDEIFSRTGLLVACVRYDKPESMLQGGSSEPRNVPLKYLRNITNNFSDEGLLGEGGFGTVYKGVLQNGETIAVKKLNSSIPGVKDRQFENEANHLMRFKHPNIVLLVGWYSETQYIPMEYNGTYVCAEKSERLLCLEYMPKGDLRGYLSDASSGLDWDTRYNIIEGICYGLRYLHEQWQPNAPIVHMDLKPANILLDNNMVPKIADFGLSRLFSQEKTWTCTISCDGTLGYMPPEYINKGLVSAKSDIFSLGVIIIEIVTGHRDYPDDTGTPSEKFIEMVLNNWSQRNRVGILFGYVSLEVEYQQIRRCIQIGLDCVKIDRFKRPTISEIIKTLHGLGSADSSHIKEVNGPQSGKRDRNCEERLTKKHTSGFSIYENFTVALHQWQNKTALLRIRVIFTAVVFVALLKKRAYGNAAAASNIQDALRERAPKLQTKAIQLANPDTEATSIVAAMRIQYASRNYNKKKSMRAAVQARREFMDIRTRVIKIQAAYRGHQVRRQYHKVLWSVGVVEEAILRWRKKRKGLSGIATGMPVEMATDAEAASTAEEDYCQVDRQQAEDRFN